MLACQLVGSREVQYDVGTSQSKVIAWRQGCPHVLTDLDAEAGAVAGAEHLWIGRHMNGAACEIDVLGYHIGAGGKPPFLIELVVVGQVGLRDKSQQRSVLYHSGTVIQQRTYAHGQTHHRDDVELACEVEQHQQAFLGLVQQQLLTKQVLTTVACQRQLGKHDDLRSPTLCLSYQALYLLNVVRHIGHPHTWYGSGHLYHSVSHSILLIPYLDELSETPCPAPLSDRPAQAARRTCSPQTCGAYRTSRRRCAAERRQKASA